MPNEAIVYSGPYEVERLRRRRDRRVQEYLFRRSIRTHVAMPDMTPCRIAKLVLYFIVFFVVLAAFTGGMALLVMAYHIPPDMPGCKKFPGLSSVPGKWKGDVKHILWGDANQKQLGAIRRQMSRAVERYGLEGQRRLMPCNLDDSWGYATGKPCILLKLTQALGFEAITYDHGIDLPDDAPDELYNYLSDLGTEARTNRIWVHCSFKKEEGLDIHIEYVPERFFDSEHLFTARNVFLNRSSDDETSTYEEDPSLRRIIGVQFAHIPSNRDIYIRCQVWAKNIPFYMGTVRFHVRRTAPVHPTTPLVLDEWYEKNL
ncbi:sodium/potassium-transporting ATPase subunit beta [Drosophila biarmipes]|uniref:sodium/potassium-transporting ATPase subunit beta n=1 Tax=Drosophila biarmipes TaxID=125945 RepID=UPI0007E89524|nr:sodium/potassium-transporting ATPase subunit beta [Drosophila biarmipes]